MNNLTNGPLHQCINESINRCMNQWINESMNQFNSIQEAREVPWAPRSKWGTPSRSRLDQGFSTWHSLGLSGRVSRPNLSHDSGLTPSTSVLPNRLFLVLIKCWWIEFPFREYGIRAFTIISLYDLIRYDIDKIW